MTTLALKICAKPGCTSLAADRFCAAHEGQKKEAGKNFDKLRRDEIRKLYVTGAWLYVRKVILARDRLCKLCGLSFSTVVDHVIGARKWIAQHGGDLQRFYDEENLQGLCKSCHDSKTAKECGWAGGER